MAPYADPRASGAAAASAAADPRVRPRVRPQPRLLALPARGPARQAPDGLLRPALARPVRAVRPRARDHRPARRRPGTRARRARAQGRRRAGRALDGRHGDHRLRGAASGGVRGAGQGRRADLDDRRGTAAAPHPAAAGSPTALGQLVAPRVIAALAKAPELVDSARRPGSNIGFLVADQFAFGRKDAPAAEVEFLDEMLAGHLVRRARGVLPQLHRPRQVREPRAVRGGADHDHLRDQGQAHLDRAQPQARRADPRRAARRVHRRRPHGHLRGRGTGSTPRHRRTGGGGASR